MCKDSNKLSMKKKMKNKKLENNPEIQKQLEKLTLDKPLNNM